MAWLLLAIAIVAEVIGTLSLKQSDGFSRLWPSVVTIVGYTISIALLAIAVKTLDLGVVYAIWSGVGTALVVALSWLIFDQKIDLAAGIGIALIVAGVLVINLFSIAAE